MFMPTSSFSCLYCPDPAPNGNEHVISRLLFDPGPNTFTLKEVCKSCNQYFGDALENDFRRDSFEGVLAAQYGVKNSFEVIVFNNRLKLITQGSSESLPLSKALARITQGGIKGACLESQIIVEKPSGNKHYFWLDRVTSDSEKKRVRDVVNAGGRLFAVLSSASDLARLDNLMTELGLPAIPAESFYFKDEYVHIDVCGDVRIDRLIDRVMAKNAFNVFASTLKATGNLALAYSKDYCAVRDFIRNDSGRIPFSVDQFELEHYFRGALPRFSPTHAVRWHIEAGELIANLQFFNHVVYTMTLGPAPPIQFSNLDQVGLGYIIDIFNSGEPPLVPIRRVQGNQDPNIDPVYFDLEGIRYPV